MIRIRLVKKLKGTDNINFHSRIGLEDFMFLYWRISKVLRSVGAITGPRKLRTYLRKFRQNASETFWECTNFITCKGLFPTSIIFYREVKKYIKMFSGMLSSHVLKLQH